MQCSPSLQLSQGAHVTRQEQLTWEDALKTTLPDTVHRAWQDVAGMRACLQKAMQHLQAGQEALTQAHKLDVPLEPWQVQKARLSSVFLQRSHTWVHTLPQTGPPGTLCTAHQVHGLEHVFEPSQHHNSITIGGGLIPGLYSAADSQTSTAHQQVDGASFPAVPCHISQQGQHASAAQSLRDAFEPAQLQLAQLPSHPVWASNSNTPTYTATHAVGLNSHAHPVQIPMQIYNQTATGSADSAGVPVGQAAAFKQADLADASLVCSQMSATHSAPDVQHPPTYGIDDLDSMMVPTPPCVSSGPGSSNNSSAEDTNTGSDNSSSFSSSAGGFECPPSEASAFKPSDLDKQPYGVEAQSSTVHDYLMAALGSEWLCGKGQHKEDRQDEVCISDNAAGQHEPTVTAEAMLAAFMMPVAAHSVISTPAVDMLPTGAVQQLLQPIVWQQSDQQQLLPLELQVHALLQGAAAQAHQSHAPCDKQHCCGDDAALAQFSEQSLDGSGLLTQVQQLTVPAGADKGVHACSSVTVTHEQAGEQAMSSGLCSFTDRAAHAASASLSSVSVTEAQAGGQARGSLDIIWHADGSVQATLRRGCDQTAGTPQASVPQQAEITQQMPGMEDKVGILAQLADISSPVRAHATDSGFCISPNPLYRQQVGDAGSADQQGSPRRDVRPAPGSPTQHSCSNLVSTQRNPLYEPRPSDVSNAAQRNQPARAHACGQDRPAPLLTSASAAGTAYVASLRRLAASRRARQQAQLHRQQLPADCADQEQQTGCTSDRAMPDQLQAAYNSGIAVKAVQQQDQFNCIKQSSTSLELPAVHHTSASQCAGLGATASARSSLADMTHASDWEVVMHSRKLTQHILQQAALLLSPQGKAPQPSTRQLAPCPNHTPSLQEKLVAAAAISAQPSALAVVVDSSAAAVTVMAGALSASARRHSAVAVISIDVPGKKGTIASSPAAPEPTHVCL